MPPTKLTKLKTFHIEDGAKRGPLTMSQVSSSSASASTPRS